VATVEVGAKGRDSARDGLTQPDRVRKRPVLIAKGAMLLAFSGVLLGGASLSPRAIIEAAAVADIPSLGGWITAAPHEFRRLVDDDIAAAAAGASPDERHVARLRTFHLVGASRLEKADDALVVRHLRLSMVVAQALRAHRPDLCVRFFEQGSDGEIERALPGRLRTDWIRLQGDVLRAAGRRPVRRATPDEEVLALTRAAEIGARLLRLDADAFIAAMLGRAPAATVCDANIALIEGLLAQGPQTAARVTRSRAAAAPDP